MTRRSPPPPAIGLSRYKRFFSFTTLFFAFVLAGVFAACAGLRTPPEWAENLEAAFPGDRYIAARGASAKRETAPQSALTALSSYVQTQISSRTDMAESYAEQNGAVSSSMRLEQQTLIQTETELFAVRYTDPWWNPAIQMWEMIAYIDRSEAWSLFEPRLSSRAAPFMAVFEAAEHDPEPLRRFLRYKAAEGFDAAALRVYLDFARTLDPGRAAAFDPVRQAVAALPQRMNQAKFEASVYIDCPVDLDGATGAALTSALSAEGFPVTRDRNVAGAICLAIVEEGLEKRDAGTFYNPALTLSVAGKTGAALFSMTINAPRQSAINPDIARRRGYAALAGEIQAQFHTEWEKQIAEQRGER
ncbi:MAG: LPP20 family lipoprotein [Treponema sp.]|jgi:hypothetical protein|nr:LPP20 family lipoprotein [Treponema sp.]